MCAQVNLACGHSVDLRATLKASCAEYPSCVACEDSSLTDAQRIVCYAAGCSCYGTSVTTEAECTGDTETAAKASYSCPQMATTIVLPAETMASMYVRPGSKPTPALLRGCSTSADADACLLTLCLLPILLWQGHL